MIHLDKMTMRASRLGTTLQIVIWTIFFLFYCSSSVYGKTPLKVGVYSNKPTIFADQNGVAQGLFIDILEHIAASEDWQLEYVIGNFSELLDELTKGSIDLLPAVAYSRVRDQNIDYTFETVMANWAELYVAGSSRLTSLLELQGKKIAVKQGDIHFQALKTMTENFNLDCRFLETDEYETVFEMLSARYADVGVVNRLYGNRNKIDYYVKATPVIFNPIEMRYAVPEGRNQQILNRIDSSLTAFKRDENSIYYQAVNRWFVVDAKRGLPKWVLYLLAAIAGVTSLLLGSMFLLRYQVKKRTSELTRANEQLESQIEVRRRVEEELRKFARIVEASSDAMALVDKDHRHVLVNTAYLRTFGIIEKDIGEVFVQELFGEGFFTRELQESVITCLQGQVVHVQTKPNNGKNEPVNWNITLSPYHGYRGEISGYVIDIRDVTQEVELQNRLKNAQKMEAIGMLAGGVAHDLNNILSGLVSYPDMLLVNRQTDDPMTQPLQTIKRSGERAAAIVQDLLTLARGGIGSTAPLNLNDIMSEYLDSPEHREIIREAEGVIFSLKLDETLGNVRGSAAHLTKILMNLITNAVEAMPGGGRLTVTTENRHLKEEFIGYEVVPPGDYVVIRLSDTGVGMSPAELGRIFEPFYTSKVMGRSGTGLGMAVVWGAIRDHNAYIDVTSELGKGTSFSLYFNVTKEQLPKSEDTAAESPKGNGQKILVVDDMEEQRVVASEILEILGYSVDAAPSGEEAVAMCQKTEYALIVLDMIMPGGMDGLATFKKITTFKPGQKAIIASGFSDTSRVRKAQNLGAGPYIKKPYSVNSLAKAISEELHSA